VACVQGLLAGEAPAAALSCANAMGAFVATQVRAEAFAAGAFDAAYEAVQTNG
jgi:hypothetical protein